MLSRWATTRLVRPGHELGNCHLDLPLRLGIHRAGGLVQHQDRRIQGERPGKAQQLTLPHAQAPPPLAQSVVVPRGEPFDEPVRPHPARSLSGRFRRNRGIERQVVLNVSGKQKEILLHEADQRPEVRGR